MPRISNCPHCSKPILDDSPDPAEKLRPQLDSISFALSALTGQNRSGDLHEVQDTLSHLTQELQKGMTELAESKAGYSDSLEALNKSYTESHQDFLGHLETCPDCKPKWETKKAEIVEEARKGYIPEELAREALRQMSPRR